MAEQLERRRVIVTGAARGIGAAVVRGFIARGARVVAMDVRDELGQSLAQSLGAECAYLHCDVSCKAEVDAAFDAAVARLQGLDALLNVAGIDRPGAAAEDIAEADWTLVLATNATGTFLTNQAACRIMQRGGGGAIVNFGSVAGVRGLPDRAAYSAAKGAVHAWTRAVAQAWGRYDITVNTIAPIMATEVATKFLDRLDAGSRAAYEATLAERIPLGGRMGEPLRDLVPLLAFLAGPGARYMTGQTFAVDGGMMMVGS